MAHVSFDGGTVPLEDVQENPGQYARRLERAKITPGFALCLCKPANANLRLVIRRYRSLFHLAGWPDDGHRHAPGCGFYKDPNRRPLPGGDDPKAAIVATPAGLNIKLDVSLTQRDVRASAGITTPPGGTRAGRRSATLLAFLQTLWASAGLHCWNGLGTTRHWGLCNAQLLAELGDAVVNGRGAQDVLHVMRRYQEADRAAINAEFDAFVAGLTNGSGAVRRGVLIGEVAEVTPTQYGHSLVLRQNPRKYYASPALFDHAAKTWPHAWKALGDRAARIVAALLVEKTVKGHLRIVNLALMLCSSAYVPCDSIHEVSMANRLVSEYRSFEKQMRLADGDDMLPDFVLRDTEPRTHIEVYGMNGVASYEERKAEKRELRRQRGIPAVEWDVDRTELSAVTLPEPVHRRAASLTSSQTA
ncbi:DUF1173 family protein [Paraburkholderia rhizosphaerae]|uniref:Uncharacterized protein DUF1173 n=1 Tax=Paraburkholderia rhizosphaerae TaxID=480658 RepID=A0A4R8LPP7_9BURK|nr:DUF1173 family protein [Paraburkholderia rhizosphaerae]TDY48298.1 uncharacterized protein DUF1173 [Paraburkholderia rhizosphaerae]